MRRLARLGLASLLLTGMVSAQERGAAVPVGPHVITAGSGRITTSADRAVIKLTATGREKTAEEAKTHVETVVGSFVEGLAKLNIDTGDYSVSGLELDREIEYQEDREVPVGFLAERTITVNLKDTLKIDPVIQRALKSGITAVNSVDYSLSSWGQVKQRARSLAITDAKQKATFIAEEFRACLGDVYSIDTSADSDDGTYGEVVVTTRKVDESRRKPEYLPGKYDAGQVDVNARLNVVFSLRSGNCS